MAIRQEIDNLVPLQINKDCPIAMTTAPRPVVDSEYSRVGRIKASAGLAHQPQQRVCAGWHGQPLGQPHAGLSTKRQSEMALQVAQPSGSTASDRCRFEQAFGKSLSGTSWVHAAKAPRLDLQRHRPALPRQIG